MTNASLLYFDNNATTAVDERVLEAMLPYFRETYGNASSRHPQGEAAGAAVAAARREVANLVGAAAPDQVVFTSGGTESDGAGILAAWSERPPGADTILVSAVEHPAVLAPAERVANVERVAVDANGRLDVEAALRRIEAGGIALVSAMYANNETGVVTPAADIARLGAAAHAAGAALQVDAVQAIGKIPVDFRALGADFLSLSAHKFHGPKGVGAWIVATERFPTVPALVAGGSQEAARRGGTLNVPGIVGLGAAARLAREAASDCVTEPRVAALRDAFEARVLAQFPGTRVIGAASPRLPNTSNLCFAELDGEALLMALAASGICASMGAACSATRRTASHVLLAYGLSAEEAARCLRFSFSRDTTEAEIEQGLDQLALLIAALAPTAR
ncbi:MAG: aminotransferase class V-fold PLP-dependent enzyme [Planctomycetota bacterium]